MEYDENICFSWIKGNKVPQKMLFDFCHYMPNGDVGSIQIRYEKEKLQFVTGYMQKEFSLDKKGKKRGMTIVCNL